MQRARNQFRLLFQLLLVLLCFPVSAAIKPQGHAEPFLTSTLSGSRPYVGEEVMLTYTLYFRDTAPRISEEVTPTLQGLWAKEAKPERFIRSTPATFSGEQYRCAVIKRFRLVPVKAGKITVTGYSMNCAVPAGKATAGGTEPPDIITGITAPPVTLDARPLPGPPPRGYTGAVGTFSIELLADKQKVRAGEPITLNARVSGKGSLLTLAIPALQLPESFRRGTSEIVSSLQSESAVSSGSTTSTTVVWPQTPGKFMIPPLRMDVFDPQTGKFRSVGSAALTLNVDQPQNIAGAPEKSGNKAPETTLPDEKRLFRIPFIFIAAIAGLLFAGALIFLAAKKRHSPHPSANQAEAFVETGNSPQEIKKLIFDLIEKAGIKGSAGLTRNQLKEALQKKTDIPADFIPELTGLLDTIDRILFTSSTGKEAPLPEDSAERLRQILKVLSTCKASP